MKRPPFKEVDLQDALAFDWRSYRLSIKADGVTAIREWNGCRVWGDAMADGRLMVWDIERAFGQDVSRLATSERERATAELFSNLSPKLNWHRCPVVSGAEGIEAAIANGEEGTVGIPWDAPFNAIRYKVKRSITVDCRIEAKLLNAVLLSQDGEPAGKCPLRGWKYEAASVGDIIEVKAYQRNVSGAFREPRFIRFRADKMIPLQDNLPGDSLSFSVSL